jgi:hypothetical protein
MLAQRENLSLHALSIAKSAFARWQKITAKW